MGSRFKVRDKLWHTKNPILVIIALPIALFLSTNRRLLKYYVPLELSLI
jgi:hypothetical protein